LPLADEVRPALYGLHRYPAGGESQSLELRLQELADRGDSRRIERSRIGIHQLLEEGHGTGSLLVDRLDGLRFGRGWAGGLGTRAAKDCDPQQGAIHKSKPPGVDRSRMKFPPRNGLSHFIVFVLNLSMATKYHASALLFVFALLTACVPNRRIAYPTAQAINCSPNDVFLSDIASRTSDGDIVETWNAKCHNEHFRCTLSKGATTCQPITAEMAAQPSRAATAPVQPVVGSSLTQTIFPLIQRIWNAHRQRDPNGEGELLTHDYTSVHADGSFHSGKRTTEEIQG